MSTKLRKMRGLCSPGKIGGNNIMKILPLNNCGVEIKDVDISTLTEPEYQEIKHIYQDLSWRGLTHEPH
jgi:hypothetical protein